MKGLAKNQMPFGDALVFTKKSLFVLSMCFTFAYSQLGQLAREDSISGGWQLESLAGTVKSTNRLQTT